MADHGISDSQLEAYLDDALPVEEMSHLEQLLRSDRRLQTRLAEVSSRRDHGFHSVGAIWRRHRLSCPGREQLGSYLLGAMAPEGADYIRFHLETIGCRFCEANLADLEQRQAEAAEQVQSRRRRYFQSSAGLLSRK